jgi:CHASE3 domain sensor protein
VKPDRKFFSTRQLVILGMSVPVLLTVLVGCLQWQSAMDFRSSREKAVHTRTVLFNLESFLACMYDAETGQRGYLLTHKENYLAPYTQAVSRSSDLMQMLQQLSQSSPELQDDLGHLESLMNAKLNELAQTVALEKNMDHAGAMKIIMSDFGKNTMDQILALLNKMHGTERALLLQREAVYQHESKMNFLLSGLLIAIDLGFIVGVFLLLRRMEKMEDMITICAWSKMIEYEGEWLSIEEYLTRRLHARISHGMSDVEAQKMLKLIEQERPRKAA